MELAKNGTMFALSLFLFSSFLVCCLFLPCHSQPIDCKRDQFRKYIESKGVIDTITKVLIKLLETPVKPEHPLDFIRDNLGPTLAEKHRTELLEQQLADYKQEVSDLKARIGQLQTKLSEKEALAEVPAVVAASTEADPKKTETAAKKTTEVAPKPADDHQQENDTKKVTDDVKNEAGSKTEADATVDADANAQKPDEKIDETTSKPAEVVKCGGGGAEAGKPAEQEISVSEKAATPVEPPSNHPVVIETSDAEKADVATANGDEVTLKKADG